MRPYEFDVLVHGKSVTKYVHEGRVYIEGRAGSEFTLVVKNHTPGRILAVVSVDGLSVMDGKPASKKGRGYVLNGFETMKIPGWRLNDESVAKFQFGAKGKSYAASKRKALNVGAIACAFFEEDTPTFSITYTNGNPWPASSGGWVYTCDSCPPSGILSTTDGTDNAAFTCATQDILCSNNASGETVSCNYVESASPRRRSPGIARGRKAINEERVVQNIGTEFGKRTAHTVTTVTFEAKSEPAEVVTIHYDDRAGLKAKGVDVTRKIHVADPFPADSSDGCEPPNGWRG